MLAQPYAENPYYLSWDGVPVFPLGPANQQSWHPISRIVDVDFDAQLERLAGVIEAIDSPHVIGFVRCIPYEPFVRDAVILQPWQRLEDGRYDLNQIAPEWEARFRAYMDKTLALNILVSLEIWDDWSVTRGVNGAWDPGPDSGWNAHPFNPENNINYDADTLPVETSACNAPFYQTIPALDNNETVLELQHYYVDYLLDIASEYPNIIINLSNESRATLAWSRYWAAYVRERMPAGTMIGDMPSTNRQDGGGECEDAFSPLTLSTDPLYDYIDAGQGVSRHEFGEPERQALGGGERLRLYRQAMEDAGTIRPMVVSKDYTNNVDGGDIVIWSRFVGGASAARFHRGNAEATDFQHEAAERLGRFIAEAPFWTMAPMQELVTQLPEGAGVNVLAAPESHCIIQLLGGGAGETLQVALAAGDWSMRWIDPATGAELASGVTTSDGAPITLEIPGDLDHRVLHLSYNG